MFYPKIYKLVHVMATRETVYVVGRKIATTKDGTSLIVTDIQKDYSNPFNSRYRIFVKNSSTGEEHLHDVLENCSVALTFDKDESY